MEKIRNDVAFGLFLSSTSISFSGAYYIFHQYGLGWCMIGSVLSGLVIYGFIRERLLKNKKKNMKRRNKK